MDGTITAAVPVSYGGGRALLGDRVTSQRDDDVDAESGALLDVLTRVQHAYTCLLQSNNGFYPGHGTNFNFNFNDVDLRAPKS